VAEWQTRRSQTPLIARSCGFESHLRHHHREVPRRRILVFGAPPLRTGAAGTPMEAGMVVQRNRVAGFVQSMGFAFADIRRYGPQALGRTMSDGCRGERLIGQSVERAARPLGRSDRGAFVHQGPAPRRHPRSPVTGQRSGSRQAVQTPRRLPAAGRFGTPNAPSPPTRRPGILRSLRLCARRTRQEPLPSPASAR
jgi:hypothetical protein